MCIALKNTFLPSFNLQPTAYFRYIDDIILIWSHCIDTLETFLLDANENSLEHNIHTYVLFYCCVILGRNNQNHKWNYIHQLIQKR